MSRTKAGVVAIACAAALGVAGCGGGGDTTTITSTSEPAAGASGASGAVGAESNVGEDLAGHDVIVEALVGEGYEEDDAECGANAIASEAADADPQSVEEAEALMLEPDIEAKIEDACPFDLIIEQ